jgi:hypothetical protein
MRPAERPRGSAKRGRPVVAVFFWPGQGSYRSIERELRASDSGREQNKAAQKTLAKDSELKGGEELEKTARICFFDGDAFSGDDGNRADTGEPSIQ